MNLHQALATMDPSKDDQWTGDGLPRLELLQKLTENPKLTRKEVTDAAPAFTRDSMQADPEPKEEPDPKEEPEVVLSRDEPAKPLEPETINSRAQERYEAIAVEADALVAEKRKLDEQLKRLAAEQQRLQPFVKAPGYDHNEDQKARMEFIESQKKIRAARAGRNSEVFKALGLKPPTSPLEAAMSRRDTPQSRRPEFHPQAAKS